MRLQSENSDGRGLSYMDGRRVCSITELNLSRTAFSARCDQGCRVSCEQYVLLPDKPRATFGMIPSMTS